MAHIITIAMPKGGVGKTTTTVNIGCNLAAQHFRVLLIDLDPQGHTTKSLGVEPDEMKTTIYDVLHRPKEGIDPALVKLALGVDLLPANLELSGAELELAGVFSRELILKNALKVSGASDRYDYILIDTPPTLGIFTVNALTAATSILIPVQVHFLPWTAIKLLDTIIEIIQPINPALAMGGIICTFTDSRNALSLAIEEQLRKQYGDLVFKTVVPVNIKLAEAPASGKPISMYAPKSSGNAAYKQLTEEVKARYA